MSARLHGTAKPATALARRAGGRYSLVSRRPEVAPMTAHVGTDTSPYWSRTGRSRSLDARQRAFSCRSGPCSWWDGDRDGVAVVCGGPPTTFPASAGLSSHGRHRPPPARLLPLLLPGSGERSCRGHLHHGLRVREAETGAHGGLHGDAVAGEEHAAVHLQPHVVTEHRPDPVPVIRPDRAGGDGG